MEGKEQIIEIYLSCLCGIDEISIAAVYWIEGEACDVHGYEIEVHSFNTK